MRHDAGNGAADKAAPPAAPGPPLLGSLSFATMASRSAEALTSGDVMMMRLLALGLLGGALLGCGTADRDSIPANGSAVLADIVADICDAEIVFLGEDGSHGGGRTFQVKAEVVRELIENCGFTHVAFESQIYDFIDLHERYVAGTATREALYDAIGRFWSRAAEIDPLVELLHEMALTGRLTISGFDGQMGDAMSYYTPTQLAACSTTDNMRKETGANGSMA